MAILKPNKVTIRNGVTINEYFLKNMFPGMIRDSVIGVTIHNTDWISTAEGTTPAEQYTRATLNGSMGDVIVHYYVDDKCAWQNLPHNVHGWHAADGSGDGNWRTIAIECIMDGSGSERSARSEDNAARLAAVILNELGFGIERLYTHQHWYSKKYCPAYILPHWEDFRGRVAGYIKKLRFNEPESNTGEIYRIRKTWLDATSQIGAYTNIDGAIKSWKEGYTVYNSKGKPVYPESASAANEQDPITLPTLKKGDNSDYVESLQCLLIGKGISCGTAGIDHIFGAKTEEAVRDFQVRVKLKETGICDSKTWAELLRY
ncbi:MAG: N-acetylmuramoyl-L-alanine amidase [Oscillospiraceae bacterium]|nr:N-acetylmuramoyl-L-alanine amidase [Oscillospiraceae bacterium]